MTILNETWGERTFKAAVLIVSYFAVYSVHVLQIMVLRETVQAAKTQVHHIAGGRGDPLYGFTEERKSPTIHNDSQ